MSMRAVALAMGAGISVAAVAAAQPQPQQQQQRSYAQRQQQPARGRLVESAPGHDLAERQPLGRLAPDQREQPERAVDALRTGQAGARRGILMRQPILRTVHDMDLVLMG